MKKIFIVRLVQGGGQYYVIILDDSVEEMPVKKIFGPYLYWLMALIRNEKQ